MLTYSYKKLSTAALLLALSTALGVTSPSALAQTGKIITNDKFSLETMVVTATRDEQPLDASSSNLSVISAQDLEQLSQVHASEAFTRVPGVWIDRGNGQEHLTAIRSPVLTGAGSCGAFVVAEDNIPVRATGFCNVNQLMDINTEQAQRIEVLRGPGTVLYGSDALHGVINVISKPSSTEAENLLSLEAGANDYGRVKYSSSDRSGQHGYRVSLNGTHDGGYKDNAGFDQQKLSARHDYFNDDITVNTQLSLSNLNQETAGYIEGYKAYKDKRLKRDNPNPEAFRDSQSARLQSRFIKQLKNDSVFIATPYARYTDMAFLMHFLPGTPLEENGQQSVGIQTLYRRPINPSFTLSNGFDAEYTDAYLKQTQDTGFGTFPNGKQYDYKVKAKLFAAFINGDYQLQPATSASAGIRWEHLEYDYNNRMIEGNTAADGSSCAGGTGCRYARPADSRDTFTNWSLNTSLTHQFNTDFSGVIRLAHGFRAPQATELYRLQGNQIEADLDAEKIDSIELSLQGATESLSYSFSSFYMKKDNVIFQSSNRLNVDNGASKHYGLEYKLHWQIAEQWDMSVAGTFARHLYTSNVRIFGATQTVDIDGNDVDTAPHQMHSAQLGWRPTEGTRLELEWISMGKYYTDIDNLHSYEGHELFNLRLRQQLTATISVGLRVNNLTDVDYAERADYSGFAGDRYFVGEPRSYFADINFKF
ncbi:MAG: TonB-dependent receptor [Spongiibacteraceae bacterium]